MSFAFGDVILVPFPFTDQSTVKRRPGVVVSSRDYGEQRPDIVLLAVSGQLRSPPSFGEAPIADWQASGLIKPSMFKPLIATIEQSLVLRRLGKLSPTDVGTLRALLGQIIGDLRPA
jgi:mRNA interferase MazF